MKTRKLNTKLDVFWTRAATKIYATAADLTFEGEELGLEPDAIKSTVLDATRTLARGWRLSRRAWASRRVGTSRTSAGW